MSSSPAPSSTSRSVMSSTSASTAATSPPPDSDWGEVKSPPPESEGLVEELDNNSRRKLLDTVLKKATVYSDVLAKQMDEKTSALRMGFFNQSDSSRDLKTKEAPSRKRLRIDSDDSDHEHLYQRKKARCDAVCDDGIGKGGMSRLKQPALVTGGKLKDYQLEGLEWMISLDQNGISGILADEMGLGKTLQTIAFNAYLREQKNFRPFLIVCPLSVLHNWVEEFARFAPAIPVCMYHGSPVERAELRRTVIPLPDQRTSAKHAKSSIPVSGHKESLNTSERKYSGTDPGRRIFRKQSEDDDDIITDVGSAHDESNDEASFPVVITTYEMIIKDRIYLSAYDFSYIVVDEGHRLKNFGSRLMQEIKKYKSAGRMLLTGTPLHNNLAELWSLLNFILPDIFTDVGSFQRWFDQPTMQENLSQSYTSLIIHQLHAILKPFLLRRLKADVEISLPPKKEYVIYAPLSERQRQLYEHVLNGGLRQFLICEDGSSDGKDEQKKLEDEDASRPRVLRSHKPGRQRKAYTEYDDDDDAFLKKAESGELDTTEKGDDVMGIEEIARVHRQKTILKQVNNMRLQNTVMQLRKVCSHPFLFNWPVDPDTRQPVLNEELVDTSGKMMVLDRLLGELFRRGHKVLLFTQFTTMLDIIEDWAIEFKGWTICRIDGSTPPNERREQMNRFQNGDDTPDAPRLFLLSTRSGGLGINLTAADTVIFYDQDWNPQMDIQAQDRAHRIGQTKPVLIFRLVSAHTIETEIMQRATEKRKLEALVIAKGKFKMPASNTTRGRQETVAELAASLLKLEGEKIKVVPNTKAGKASVLGDEDLEMLLDRSPKIFADRGQGWTSVRKTWPTDKGMESSEVKGKKTAFAVYQAPVDAGNAALAKIFGEEEV